MLKIFNAQNMYGTCININIASNHHAQIDATGLTLFPAAIDPHVHFRTPGAEHKENWITGARAAINGGVSTVIDMPNNSPNCSTLQNLIDKHRLIQTQLNASGIPLRYYLYFGADKKNLKEIPKAKEFAIGIKIFMGSSTGDLLIDDDSSLEEIFRMAADMHMLVSVHAEDEEIISHNKRLYEGITDPAVHSKIRHRSAAVKAVTKAINLSQRFNTRLCILHVSTKEEVALIREAKHAGAQVSGEAAPHHLFLTDQAYSSWGTLAQVNPPLRECSDQAALWEGLNEGTLDFIGTDHAPHTLTEKAQPYGKSPSGIPSIDLFLPLMLQAVNRKMITLETLVKITHTNAAKFFNLPPSDDIVLVDLSHKDTVKDNALQTKCAWSPYAGMQLTGWPIYTIIQGNVFHSSKHAYAN